MELKSCSNETYAKYLIHGSEDVLDRWILKPIGGGYPNLVLYKADFIADLNESLLRDDNDITMGLLDNCYRKKLEVDAPVEQKMLYFFLITDMVTVLERTKDIVRPVNSILVCEDIIADDTFLYQFRVQEFIE